MFLQMSRYEYDGVNGHLLTTTRTVIGRGNGRHLETDMSTVIGQE